MSQLLIDEPPLQVIPTLAKKVGLNEAIVLQQVHYWLNPKINKNRFYEKLWVRNTYKQWQQQFPFWSLKTIRRILTGLEEQSLLFTFLTDDHQHIKYYTINYDRLNLTTSFVESSISTDRVPCGQNDHTPLPKRAEGGGQLDQGGVVNLTTSYIDTENTYTENTLLPPPHPVWELPKEEEEENLKKLIEFWNDNVQSKLHPSAPQVQLTQTRRQQLRDLLQNLLSNDPEQWHAYCSKISQCHFLMGGSPSGFKVTLEWALKEENALKVLEGAIYDQPRERRSKELPWPDYLAELKQHCADHQYPDDWFQVCVILAQALGKSTFESWFKRLVPIDVSEEKIILCGGSNFIRDFIQSNFQWDLLTALQSVYPQTTSFEIQTKGKAQC